MFSKNLITRPSWKRKEKRKEGKERGKEEYEFFYAKKSSLAKRELRPVGPRYFTHWHLGSPITEAFERDYYMNKKIT